MKSHVIEKNMNSHQTTTKVAIFIMMEKIIVVECGGDTFTLMIQD